jgi:hypothetical protein
MELQPLSEHYKHRIEALPRVNGMMNSMYLDIPGFRTSLLTGKVNVTPQTFIQRYRNSLITQKWTLVSIPGANEMNRQIYTRKADKVILSAFRQGNNTLFSIELDYNTK